MTGVPMPTRGPCYSRQLRPPLLQGMRSNVHQKDEGLLIHLLQGTLCLLEHKDDQRSECRGTGSAQPC